MNGPGFLPALHFFCSTYFDTAACRRASQEDSFAVRAQLTELSRRTLRELVGSIETRALTEMQQEADEAGPQNEVKGWLSTQAPT